MEDKEKELIAQYLDGDLESQAEQIYDEIPIPVSFEGLLGDDNEGLIPYDVDKFRKGVRDYSYIAGAFSALRNSGMSEQNVMSWLLGEVEMKGLSKQLEAQEKITQIKADASIRDEI